MRLKTSLGFAGKLAMVFAALAGACAPAAAPSSPAAATPAARATVSPPVAATATATPRPAPATPSPAPAASAATPDYGGVLTISAVEDPATYDIHQESSLPALMPLRNVYEGLVKYHYLRHKEIAPELAERWESSADGTVYTFYLRKGVTWQDGRPFTAEDVVFSLMRMAYPESYKIASPWGTALLGALDKAEVVDSSTVRLRLKYPSASFLPSIATDWVLIMPKHSIEAKGDLKRDVNGTGPFLWTKHDRGVSIQLRKNPSYYDKSLPYLDGLTFYIIPDASTRFAAFRTGRVRMTAIGATSMTNTEAEVISRELTDRIVLKQHAAFLQFPVFMNLNRTPWKDVRVRRAVHLALDRQNVIKVASLPGVVGAAMHPQGAWGLSGDDLAKTPGYRQPKDADIAEAKRLIAEAGYSAGIKTTLLCRAGSLCQEGPALKAQLAAIGIDVTIEPVALAILAERTSNGNFDTAWRGQTDPLDDPDSIASIYTTGGSRNFGSFSDSEVDALFKEQARTLDTARRKELVRKAQMRLLELVPYPVVYWSFYQRAWWKEVKDYDPGPGSYVNLKMDRVWLARQPR